jgi:hypothetical protein
VGPWLQVRVLQSGRGGAGKMSAKFEGAVEGWFRNMATFIGAFYLQHPQVEIVGLLQCVGAFCRDRQGPFALILFVFFGFAIFVFAWSTFYVESFLGLLFFKLQRIFAHPPLTPDRIPSNPRYVVRQLDGGHTEELMIVREVLSKVGSCELVEQVTDEQVLLAPRIRIAGD